MSNRFESIADLIDGEAKKETSENNQQNAEYDGPISSIDFSSGTVTISSGSMNSPINVSMDDLQNQYSQTEDPSFLREMVRMYDSAGQELNINPTYSYTPSTIYATATNPDPLPRGEQVWQSARSSTNRSEPTTVLTYVIPYRKRLYLQSYQIQALTQTEVDDLVTVRVNSRSIDRMRCNGTNIQTRSFGNGILVAESTESISIEITPRSVMTTEWSVLLLGFLVDQ